MKPLLQVLLGVGLLVGRDATAQPRQESIQGVWKVVEVRMTEPARQTIVVPEPIPNLTILTAKHYSRVQVEAETRPVVADVLHAGADELRAAWGPFYAEAGSYEVTGNLITMHPVAAKNPATMTPGAFSVWSYTLAGDTLWVTAERNENGPVANPITIKAVRVE
jgi:hypothetical protein